MAITILYVIVATNIFAKPNWKRRGRGEKGEPYAIFTILKHSDGEINRGDWWREKQTISRVAQDKGGEVNTGSRYRVGDREDANTPLPSCNPATALGSSVELMLCGTLYRWLLFCFSVRTIFLEKSCPCSWDSQYPTGGRWRKSHNSLKFYISYFF